MNPLHFSAEQTIPELHVLPRITAAKAFQMDVSMGMSFIQCERVQEVRLRSKLEPGSRQFSTHPNSCVTDAGPWHDWDKPVSDVHKLLPPLSVPVEQPQLNS